MMEFPSQAQVQMSTGVLVNEYPDPSGVFIVPTRAIITLFIGLG